MTLLLLPAPTDDRLALSARDSDRLSRNLLYLRCAHTIRNRTIPAQRIADKLGASGAPINGEDVEQQCFLIFCQLLETWDPGRTPFITYLTDSISNAAYTYVRSIQHLRSTRIKLVHITPPEASYLPEEDTTDNNPLSPSAYDLNSRILAVDNTQEIFNNDFWDTIATYLRDDWARLIRQRFWEDKSSDQIARKTGQSRRNIDRTIQSALATLQVEVSDQWETS